MRRFLLAAGVNGRLDCLAKLEQLVRQRQPDGILFAGGVLDPARQDSGVAKHAENWKLSEDFFDGIAKPGVFTAVIPGPADVPLRQFLRLAKDAEIEHSHVHVVHATTVERSDLVVCGLGGELTESRDSAEDRLCYSRASAEYYLRTLWRAEPPRKVLLLSVAPPGELGGDKGNIICGELIDSYHPSLCLVGGPTANRGTQRIAHTLVVNPGQLSEGSAAWLDWSKSPPEQVEFLNV